MVKFTLPDHIRAWVVDQFNPAHVDKVFCDLLDVATGNREGNAFERRAIAHIFRRAARPVCPLCGNRHNLETDQDEGTYSCETCEIVWSNRPHGK